MKEEIKRNIDVGQDNPDLQVAIKGDSIFIINDARVDSTGPDDISDIGFLEEYLPEEFSVDENNLVVNENGAVVDAINIYNSETTLEEMLEKYKNICPKGEFVFEPGKFPTYVRGSTTFDDGSRIERRTNYSSHVLYLKNYEKLLEATKGKKETRTK